MHTNTSAAATTESGRHDTASQPKPKVSVAEINRALSLRNDLARFVTDAAQLDPVARAHAFRELPSVRRLLSER